MHIKLFLIKLYSWINGISLIGAIIFFGLQIRFNNNVFGVLNSIFIGIFTGFLAALLQAIFSYIEEKKRLLHEFYKNANIFDEMVIHYANSKFGFCRADMAIEQVRNLCNYFLFNIKNLFFSMACEETQTVKEFMAANIIYESFSKEATLYHELEELLYQDIKFMAMSEDELQNSGIGDIIEYQNELSRKTQEAAEKTVNFYNNEDELDKRKEAFKILENYLFKKSVPKDERVNIRGKK